MTATSPQLLKRIEELEAKLLHTHRARERAETRLRNLLTILDDARRVTLEGLDERFKST